MKEIFIRYICVLNRVPPFLIYLKLLFIFGQYICVSRKKIFFFQLPLVCPIRVHISFCHAIYDVPLRFSIDTMRFRIKIYSGSFLLCFVFTCQIDLHIQNNNHIKQGNGSFDWFGRSRSPNMLWIHIHACEDGIELQMNVYREISKCERIKERREREREKMHK